jgi:hypothetical protein
MSAMTGRAALCARYCRSEGSAASLWNKKISHLGFNLYHFDKNKVRIGNGARSLVCLHCQRPSPCNSKVGSCNYFFGACSAFTHVTACRLAESPCDPLHRELRQLCCLRCRLDCYRVDANQFPGGSCTRCSPAPFTAHCYVNNEQAPVPELP